MSGNKKYIFLFLWGIILLLLLQGCIWDDCCKQLEPSILQIQSQIEPATRSSKDVFVQNDSIGVYLIPQEDGRSGIVGDSRGYYNVRYNYDGGDWISGGQEDIYIHTVSDVYAYYPYDRESGVESSKFDPANYPFEIETVQTVTTFSSDFLWSKYEGVSILNNTSMLIFRHLLSKMTIYLSTSGISITQPELFIYNMQTGCRINLNNGMVTPEGAVNRITPVYSASDVQGYEHRFEAIVIPQQISAGTSLFIIGIDGRDFVFRLDGALHVEPESSYTYRLTVAELDENDAEDGV